MQAVRRARRPRQAGSAVAGPLAGRMLLLLAVCYLAGCGQRGPLTLPARGGDSTAVPALEAPAEEEDQESGDDGDNQEQS